MTSVRVWRAVMERGPLEAFNQFFKLRTFKFGRLVGVDKLGNKYYENTEEYKHGQHRWYEPAGFRGWFDTDVSEISPEWHGWLHQTTDDPPTEETVGSVYQMQPQTNVKNVDTPYDRNLGGVVVPHYVNQSQRRARGYGLGNSIKGPLAITANEENYYTQPGWPMDARHTRPNKHVGWTLADTAASLRANRERELGVGTLAALEAVKTEFLDNGEHAVAAVTADAELSAAADHGSARALAMRSEDAIRAEMVVCEGVIEEYSGMRGFKDAADAVARAKEQLLGLHDELDALYAAQAEA